MRIPQRAKIPQRTRTVPLMTHGKLRLKKSLLENYGVKPDHYEELENGVYQVYVEIDGKVVPYVAVDSTTGDYHG